MNQPIEEKVKEWLSQGVAREWPEVVAFIENLLEQERKKLVKRIDSFPLSDPMFFYENNWKAGYKALEEFKKAIINK